jgi:hypothetical protein
MSFKRMHLVPATTTIPSKSPYTRPLGNLDVAMREILASPEQDDYSKAKMYTQTLQRYLDVNEKYVNEPLKVITSALTAQAPSALGGPGAPPPPGAAAAAPAEPAKRPEGAYSTEDEAIDEQPHLPSLDMVPRKYRGRVTRFLNSGKVKYDEHGQLVARDGHTIPGSDVVQLVLGRVTDSKVFRNRMKGKPGMNLLKELIPFKGTLRKSERPRVYKREKKVEEASPTFGTEWDDEFF